MAPAISLASLMMMSGANAQEGGVSLPTIDVSGGDQGYQATQSQLPRNPVPLLDTPQTVNVVPEQVIKDQNISTVAEALRNVAGITFRAGEGGNQGDSPYIRGFDSRGDIFRDGIRDPGWYTRDAFSLDAVEVYKGPSSILFGRGSTGGAINLITKLPRNNNFVEGTLTGTSERGVRATIDANGKLNDNVQGRIQVMGQDYPTPGRNFVEEKRIGVAPSLSAQVSDSTKLTFSYIYQHDDSIPDRGIPFLPASYGLPRLPAPVDRATFYGVLSGPTPDQELVDAHIATVKVEHEFSSNAKITNKTRYTYVDRLNRATLTQGFNPPVGGLATYPYPPPRQQTIVNNEQWANTTDFNANFATGFLQHTFAAGVDYYKENRYQLGYANTPSAPTSVFNPNPFRFGALGALTGITDTEGETFGVYVADQIKLNRYFEILGSVRYDNFDFNQRAPLNATPAFRNLARTDETVSWRVGAVVHPTENTSVYVMRGTSFNPSADNLTISLQNAAAASAVNLDPEKSETTEVGAKAEILNRKLTLATAAFETTKTNLRIPDPANNAVQILGGEAVVKGIEFSANGYLTPQWQVISTYTYLSSEVTRTSVAAERGADLPNTPHHSFSFWSTYDVTPQLQIGGGAFYTGWYFGNTTNTVYVRDYLRFDAMAAYKLNPNATLQLNVYNLTDEFYFAQAYSNWVVPGPGRYASLTLRVRY